MRVAAVEPDAVCWPEVGDDMEITPSWELCVRMAWRVGNGRASTGRPYASRRDCRRVGVRRTPLRTTVSLAETTRRLLWGRDRSRPPPSITVRVAIRAWK